MKDSYASPFPIAREVILPCAAEYPIASSGLIPLLILILHLIEAVNYNGQLLEQPPSVLVSQIQCSHPIFL
jgi:hypothetical protein